MKPVFGATEKRIECHNACKANNDCRKCPFYNLCDQVEYFPISYDGITSEDGEFIPADFIMKGNVFC